MANATNTNLAKSSPKPKAEVLHGLLRKSESWMTSVLPKSGAMTADRMIKVALGATKRNQDLLACDPASFVLAVVQAAELGLDIGGLLGEAYLVPFKQQVQLIPGYRGLVKLARNSGLITTIEAVLVYADDHFEVERGLEPKLIHRPNFRAPREPEALLATYCIARFKDGGYQMDVMSIPEVCAIRDRSPASKNGPWVTDFGEMAKKTVVKRNCKMLPMSRELERVIEHENALDSHERSPVAADFTIDAEGVVTETGPADHKSPSESLRDDMLGDDPGA